MSQTYLGREGSDISRMEVPFHSCCLVIGLNRPSAGREFSRPTSRTFSASPPAAAASAGAALVARADPDEQPLAAIDRTPNGRAAALICASLCRRGRYQRAV